MANRRSPVLSAPAVGFAPVVPAQARILILGSLPGVASIAQQQYYAHPRNAFWPIMAQLLGFDATLDYAARLAQLRQRGIALWDVCRSAQRVGSLDSGIRAQGLVPNDIAALLVSQPAIRRVYFNGATAAALYRRMIAPALPEATDAPALRTLPSTSPAHASLSMAAKLQAWSIILSDGV